MRSYDGLLDITHGSTGVTVTNSKLSNHFKAMLIGHSDTNGAQDKKITVTLANNLWSGLNSRTPSFRFGTGHLFNNFFENNVDGINTRKGMSGAAFAWVVLCFHPATLCESTY